MIATKGQSDEMLDVVSNRLIARRGPLRERLRSAIASAIEDGTLPANEPLPSERDLAEKLGVSRSTVRACIKDLADSGLVRTRHGAGTMVTGPIPKALTRLSGFTEDVRARGLTPSTDVLDRQIGPIQPDLAMRCGLPLGTEMLSLVRLRRADGEPLSFEKVVVPVDVVGRDYDGRGSLYERLEAVGARPRRILQSLEAVAAERDIAGHLGIATGAPVLHISQVGYDAAGRAVEESTGWYRGDRYRYVGEVAG